MNLEPPLEENYTDTDLYEMEQIVIYGELTPYGEELYELSMKEYSYDEIDRKWVEIC